MKTFNQFIEEHPELDELSLAEKSYAYAQYMEHYDVQFAESCNY